MPVRPVTLVWPNLTPETVLSGGSYAATRPLTRAQTSPQSRVARTSDATVASTQFFATFSRRRTLSGFALGNHNLTTAAQIRLTVYDDSSPRVEQFSSGWMDVWPAVFESLELEWEDNNFWFGTPTDADRALYTPTFVYTFPDVTLGFQVHVEISDEANTDGYVQFGLIFLGQAWSPEQNALVGIAFDHDDPTTRVEADDRSRYYKTRPILRKLSMEFGKLTEDEAFNEVYLKQRVTGISGEILFLYRREQSIYSIQRSFIGTLERVNPIRQPNNGIFSYTAELLELV